MRIIHYSNSDGSREGVYFTEDKEMDAADAIPPDFELVSDFEIDGDFPSTFPVENGFEKI